MALSVFSNTLVAAGIFDDLALSNCTRLVVSLSQTYPLPSQQVRGFPSLDPLLKKPTSVGAVFEADEAKFVGTAEGKSAKGLVQVVSYSDSQSSVSNALMFSFPGGKALASSSGTSRNGQFIVSIATMKLGEERKLYVELALSGPRAADDPNSKASYKRLHQALASPGDFEVDSQLSSPIQVSYIPSRKEVVAVAWGFRQTSFIFRWQLNSELEWKLRSCTIMPILEPEIVEATPPLNKIRGLEEERNFTSLMTILDSEGLTLDDLSQPTPSHARDFATAIAVNEDNGWIAMGGEDGQIQVFAPGDAAEELVAFFRAPSMITGLAFDKVGRLAFSYLGKSRSRVGVWDLPDTRFNYRPEVAILSVASKKVAKDNVRYLAELESRIRALAFSPDGRTLAIAQSAQVVLLPINELGRQDKAASVSLLGLPHLEGQVEAVTWISSEQGEAALLIRPQNTDGSRDCPFVVPVPRQLQPTSTP